MKNKIIISLIVLLLISITINYKEINKNKLATEKNFHYFNLCIGDISNKLTKYDETGDRMYLIKIGHLASTIETICYLNESPSHMPRNFFNAFSYDIFNDLTENSYHKSFYQKINNILIKYIEESKSKNVLNKKDIFQTTQRYFSVKKYEECK